MTIQCPKEHNFCGHIKYTKLLSQFSKKKKILFFFALKLAFSAHIIILKEKLK